MSNVTRCEGCQGRKKIKALGNIEKDCPNCRGIGWLDNGDKSLEKELSERMDIAKPKKKPGRKPKQEPVIHAN